MSEYSLVTDTDVTVDLAEAHDWYEAHEPGLGFEFLAEVRHAYDRLAAGPYQYPTIRSGIRRALLRRFPYAVYFAVEKQTIIVLAVLHTGRDPAAWRRRR